MLENGIKLLEMYTEFLKKNPNGDFSEFGKTLSSNVNRDNNKDELTQMRDKMPFPFPAKSPDEYIGWVWGRMMSFTQIWEKKAFANQPIHNLTEFGIALYVMSHEGCSKSEVANHSLQEKTTIFENIKRLVSNGILEERPNEKDKRSKDLKLTETGKTASFIVMTRANEVSQHLVGNLNKTEKVKLFDSLIKLDGYHQHCYKKYKNDDWEKLKEEMLD
ncbi:MarR family winged helix-turn-helix transcriptional regulator [Marivirga harenae]|uniref:MarR family winged helix-turn-helix transcriptional regulator n=1 Tax=Marivirga harenae TaxID=2010992 RepID=UPI0026DEA3A6|nr:MarR family winged helix-turn-helix transcriptional regulator [Marivirga harenae]WKV10726.1 MarR family winged helix-turn-helix transcriptional regulator [Marivirga harenae]|tara:strand:- start:103348 stop:104001 length:654 start_codon:yes stop_codon:yes gene_type:complete